MDITYISPAKQGLLVLYSAAVGFCSGIICDILRSPSELLKNILIEVDHKLFCIILDFLFDILSSIIHIILIIVMIYAANEGIFRYFLLLSAFTGAYLHHISLGKLSKMISKAASAVIIRTASYIRKYAVKLTYPLRANIKSRRTLDYIKAQLVSAHRR